jgi:hypothetical protein
MNSYDYWQLDDPRIQDFARYCDHVIGLHENQAKCTLSPDLLNCGDLACEIRLRP